MGDFKVSHYEGVFSNGTYMLNRIYFFKNGTHVVCRISDCLDMNRPAVTIEETIFGPDIPFNRDRFDAIAPFVDFWNGGRVGPCPCEVMCKDRYNRGGQVVKSILIDNCPTCKGNAVLRWTDEKTVERVKSRSDRLMVVSIEEEFRQKTLFIHWDGSVDEGKIRAFTLSEDEYSTRRRQDYDEIDLADMSESEKVFIEAFKNEGEKCPCFARAKGRYWGKDAIWNIYKIVDCQKCKGNVPVTWEDEESHPNDPEYIGRETLGYLQSWEPYAQRHAISVAKFRLQELQEIIRKLKSEEMSFRDLPDSYAKFFDM
jgi:hypothetical protein